MLRHLLAVLTLAAAAERRIVTVATSQDDIVDATLDATHAYWITGSSEYDPIEKDEKCTGGAVWRVALGGGEPEQLAELKRCPTRVLRAADAAVWLDSGGAHAIDPASKKVRDLDKTPVWNEVQTDGKELFLGSGKELWALPAAGGKKRPLPAPKGGGWHGLAYARSSEELITARYTAPEERVIAIPARKGKSRTLASHPEPLTHFVASGAWAFAVQEGDGETAVVKIPLDPGPVTELYRLRRYFPAEFVLLVVDGGHLYAALGDGILRIGIDDERTEPFVPIASATVMLQDSERVYWVEGNKLLAANK
jgi:hypothetical protein